MSTAVGFDLIAVSKPRVQQIENTCRPMLSQVLIMLADILVQGVMFWWLVRVYPHNGHFAASVNYLQCLPILLVLSLFYWMFNAHPRVSVCQIEEIKNVTIANTFVFLCILVALPIYHASNHSILIAFAAFVFTLPAIPIARCLVRFLGASYDWWGHPVVVLGDGEAACSVLRRLHKRPGIGMRPIAVAGLRPEQRQIAGVPVCSFSQLNGLKLSGVRHAIVAAPELSKSDFQEVLERGSDIFPHVTIIPDPNFFWKTGSQTGDFLGQTGLSVRNNLLLPGSRLAKRLIDLTFCLLIAPILLPGIALTSILIVLDSGRPIFFSQRRFGRNGKTFKIWKFRTMVRNAEQVRREYVGQNPEIEKEWSENQKLRCDPRITRIGKVLRKTSLDELPQFWNIVRGEMSLVGPRPIIHEEIPKYKQVYTLYAKTTPGLTGLWQVSGRNQTTYTERVAHDAFYVRNWSVWLDIFVLAKTIVVVITGYGAY